MHGKFGTYGAWLNPAPGDDPRIEYAPQLDITMCIPSERKFVGA